MRFEKWHALGNAYLLVESGSPLLTASQVQRLCDVRVGIGADGVLEVTSRGDTRAEVRIWNPDGSTAEQSGNGTRIAAAWLLRESGADEVEIDTGSRVVRASRTAGEGIVRQELGPALVAQDEHRRLAREPRGLPEQVVVGDQVAGDRDAQVAEGGDDVRGGHRRQAAQQASSAAAASASSRRRSGTGFAAAVAHSMPVSSARKKSERTPMNAL